MTKHLISWFGVAALLLTGCFSTIDGSANLAKEFPLDGDADSNATSEADGDGETADADSESETSINSEGVIFYMRHDAAVAVPVVEQTASGTIENLMLLEPTSDGKAYQFTFCDQITTIDSGLVPPTEVPQSLKDAMNKDENRLKLALDGDKLAAADNEYWVWGVKLPDPVNSPMPALADPYKPCPYDKAATDPNNYEYDQDEDGHPGITIHVLANINPEGQRFMAERFLYNVKAGKTSSDGKWTVGGFSFVNTMSSFCSLTTDGKENRNISLLAGITDTGTSQWAVVRLKSEDVQVDGDSDSTVDGDAESTAADGDADSGECAANSFQCRGNTVERCANSAWIYYRDCTLDNMTCQAGACVAAADGDADSEAPTSRVVKKSESGKLTCAQVMSLYQSGYFKTLPSVK